MIGAIGEGLKTFAVSLIASIILIFMGIIYFGITLFVIKFASSWFFGAGLDANWAVLSAAIMSAAGILVGIRQ